MRALAVVTTAAWTIEFREVQVPDPGPEDVVIRVMHSWISSGTEGSFIRGERIGGDTPRGPDDPLPFPHVPGYQKVGTVMSAGRDAREFQPGDVVFATVSRVDGMFYSSGGHVSPAVTHRSQVYRLTEGTDPASASGAVLTQVGFNGGMRPMLEHGQAAAVLGDGLVGHWTAQTLRLRSARVLLAGRHDDRLNRDRPAPGDRHVLVSEEALAETVKEWAPDGIQVLVDTVGSIDDVNALLTAMRRCGQIVSLGFYGENGSIDVQKLRDRELSLHAPSGWARDRVEATLRLIASGDLATLPLVTHRFPAHRANEAYALILERREPALGVLLDWEEAE